MDTITHIAAGALVGEAIGRPKLGWAAPVVGAVAGVLPDLDAVADLVSGDPLGFIHYHRAASHALVAIPVIALVVAAVAALVTRRVRLVPWYLLVAAAGAATHVLLDLATNYGMVVLWPFDRRRIALNWLPFIDPYLLALLIGALWVSWRHLRRGRAQPDDGGPPARRPPWRRSVLRGLAAVGIYVLGMGAFHHMAMQRLGRELGGRGLTAEQITRASCAPVPLVPVAWNAFYSTDDGRAVHVGVLWIMRQGTARFETLRSDGPSPAIDAFARSEAGRTWLGFARFPVIRQQEQADGTTVVRGWDARFQTWMPVVGRLRGYGSAIRAVVTSDGRVTDVSVGGDAWQGG